VRLVAKQGVSDRVVDAFKRVRREDFVPRELRHEAYGDRPVPLPENQTTSQPSLIARMIDVADPKADDVVLEIGTGYGFQTALLAQLARRVFSVERFDVLAKAARENLASKGIENATVVEGDGWQGLPSEAPFDAVVVSAAAPEVPPALEEQLAEGGRLVIPLAGSFGEDVVVFVKRGDRLSQRQMVTPARFVPLVRGKPQRGE
jgi:protein-L-isoaspartate(D-aspartate) O-methyltransferase